MLNLGKCGCRAMLRLEVNQCFDLFPPGMYIGYHIHFVLLCNWYVVATTSQMLSMCFEKDDDAECVKWTFYSPFNISPFHRVTMFQSE